MGFSGLGRTDVGERGAGDLFVVGGFPEVEIGDTFADPAKAKQLTNIRTHASDEAEPSSREHSQSGRLHSAPPTYWMNQPCRRMTSVTSASS